VFVAPVAFRTRLARRASKAAVFLPGELADRLTLYYELLERWNRKINLTSLDDPDEAIDRLLLEAVIAARHLPQALPAIRLMDVGSGGGSPALPMTLAGGPRVALTMVEVKTRKSAFLREAVRQLGLASAIVENARFEELLAQPELHERFDALSIRAVRLDPRVLMSLQAFLKPGAVMLLFRGPSGPERSAAVIPPLEWVATVPLVEPLRSRLSILRKVATSAHVPKIGA
jgi:16S rRNA (guanine527-N7)-methyltransferase